MEYPKVFKDERVKEYICESVGRRKSTEHGTQVVSIRVRKDAIKALTHLMSPPMARSAIQMFVEGWIEEQCKVQDAAVFETYPVWATGFLDERGGLWRLERDKTGKVKRVVRTRNRNKENIAESEF